MAKRIAKKHDLDEFHEPPKKVKVAWQDVGPQQGGMELEPPLVNILRIPERHQYYAFVEKIEIEHAGRRNQRVLRYHLMLECIRKNWFDDLVFFPPATNIPQEAGMLMVEVTITPNQLATVRDRMAVPHIHEHWWIQLTLTDDPMELEVIAYPIEGQNAATIGNRPNAHPLFLEKIGRVRPPNTLMWLNQYAASLGA
jgi:hypothetical protein